MPVGRIPLERFGIILSTICDQVTAQDEDDDDSSDLYSINVEGFLLSHFPQIIS